MEISALHAQPTSSPTLNIPSLAQPQPVDLPKTKANLRANMRKFMSESAASTSKIRKNLEIQTRTDSHYDDLVKELQTLVNLEEVKRKLKDLDKEIENFERGGVKKIYTSFLYQTRSAIHFLSGNLKEAFADEWAFHSLQVESANRLDFPFLRYSSYYADALNDDRISLIINGVGAILFNQEKQGIENLNRAASSGSSHALLLLLALGETPPTPMDCDPIPLKGRANEDFFAHLTELFQRQKYKEVVEEANHFLVSAELEDWERGFFLHLRGGSKSALNNLSGAIEDYDQSISSYSKTRMEWVIERALVKIRAGDREGAKTDLQGIRATRYEPSTMDIPESAYLFATYTFDPWKTRALMIEKLFDL